MSGEVWEEVYDRIAELTLAHRTNADFRQHAPHGRARHPRPVGAARRRSGRGASRQPVEGTPARRRAAAQGRRAEGAGRDRLARARHRYRRCRSRLPARFAAFDRGVAAARRALRTRGRGHAEGPAVPAVARRTRRMRRAARQRRARRTRPSPRTGAAVGRAGAADRRRGRGTGMGRGRAVRAVPPRVSIPRPAARGFRRDRRRCWRKGSARGAAGAAR